VKRKEKNKRNKETYFSFCFFFVCFFFFFSSISPLVYKQCNLKAHKITFSIFEHIIKYVLARKQNILLFVVAHKHSSPKIHVFNMTRKKRKFVFKHLTWKKEPIRHLVFSLYFFFFLRFVCCFYICIFLLCFFFFFLKKKKKKKHKKKKQNKNSFCKTKEKKKEK
jgi:hypothetical protein